MRPLVIGEALDDDVRKVDESAWVPAANREQTEGINCRGQKALDGYDQCFAPVI